MADEENENEEQQEEEEKHEPTEEDTEGSTENVGNPENDHREEARNRAVQENGEE